MTTANVAKDNPPPNFLALLDGAPEQERWPLVRQWLKDYPQELGAAFRAERPIYQTPDAVLISTFDEVIEALDQPEIFSVQLYKPKMGSYLMTEDNTPTHNEDKEIMMSLLRREDVPRVRSFVARTGEALLDKASGEIELINDFSRLVPAMMVQAIFGLDGVDPRKLIGWSYWNQYSAFRNQEFNLAANSKTVERKKFRSNVMAALYMARLMWRKSRRLKRGKPDNDTVTRLLQENFPKHGSLKVVRKGINAGGLLIGAIETTSEAVAHILSELNERPEFWQKAHELAQDENPAKFDLLCWEALRYRPIAPYIIRKMAADYTFKHKDGRATTLKTGQTVLCHIGSAMFDSSAYPHPDTFDITRSFGKSFHFGYGHHQCLGLAIGMVMVPEIVRQLFRRPGLRVVTGIEYLGKPFPEKLVLAWD